MKCSSLLSAASLALVAASFSSCIINANSHTSRSGKFVSHETLSRLEPGKGVDYVEALLGAPSSKTKLTDGTEIWKWDYCEKKSSQSGLIFVIDSDQTTETRRSTYVEFKDGLVTKAWQD